MTPRASRTRPSAPRLARTCSRSTQATRDERKRSAGGRDHRTPAYLCGDGSGGGSTRTTTPQPAWSRCREARAPGGDHGGAVPAAAPSGTLAVQVAAKVVTLASLLSHGPGDEPGFWTTITAPRLRSHLTASLAGSGGPTGTSGGPRGRPVPGRRDAGALRRQGQRGHHRHRGACHGRRQPDHHGPLALWGGADARATPARRSGCCSAAPTRRAPSILRPLCLAGRGA